MLVLLHSVCKVVGSLYCAPCGSLCFCWQHQKVALLLPGVEAPAWLPVQKRVEVLEKILKRRMEPFLKGDKDAFQQEIQKEADKLACMPFGVPLMHIIG